MESSNETDRFIGLTIENAELLVDNLGLISRVVQLDDQHYTGTADINPMRINFTVTHGIVTKATKG